MSKFKLILGLLLAAAITVSAATVVRTRSEYYGVCSKLDGFPGFLQRNGFLQAGTCTTKIGGTLCSAGTACTVSGQNGICRNDTVIGGSIKCTCVVASSSGF